MQLSFLRQKIFQEKEEKVGSKGFTALPIKRLVSIKFVSIC